MSVRLTPIRDDFNLRILLNKYSAEIKILYPGLARLISLAQRSRIHLMFTEFTIRWLPRACLITLLLSLHVESMPIFKRAFTQVGDTGVFCNSTPGWSDVATFFITNFVIHVFTVKSDPGNGDFYAFLFSFLSLIFPYNGVLRACRIIEQAPIFDKNGKLGCAARAGALCVVARTKGWKTKVGQSFWCLTQEDSPSSSDIVLDNLPLEFLPEGMVTIHGEYCLPPGYMMVRLPVGAAVKPLPEAQNHTCELHITTVPTTPSTPTPSTLTPSTPTKSTLTTSIVTPSTSKGSLLYSKIRGCFRAREIGKAANNSSNSTRSGSEIASTYSILNAAAGIGQLYFAVASIYKASDVEIKNHGYAAYPLTVIPYALMTVVNLIALFLTPDYPAIYMIESSIMTEARDRGGYFAGTVGTLDELDGDDARIPSDKKKPCPWEIEVDKGTEESQSYKAYKFENPVSVEPVISEETAIGSILNKDSKSPEAWNGKSVDLNFRNFFEWLMIFYVVVTQDQFNELPLVRLFHRFRHRDLRNTKDSPYQVLHRISRHLPGRKKPTPLTPLQTRLPRIGRFKYNHLTTFDRSMSVVSDLLLIVLVASPYLIVYALTKYNPQQSTFFERFWVTTWLAFGQLAITVRIMWAFVHRFLAEGVRRELKIGLTISFMCGAVWMIPAFGGFVVVAKMILKTEVCTKI